MPVSKAQNDRRSCPACGAEVVSEIWFIVHRHERPKLWVRAPDLRTLTCPNGHNGPVCSPLILFDPGSPFVIYSPANDKSTTDVKAEGDYLMALLWESLLPDEKRHSLSVELVPADILPRLLNSPKLNLGDMAPGATPTDNSLQICSDIRSGQASPAQLREWAKDAQLPRELRAGIRFELATFLSRDPTNERQLIEEAISEWRQVLKLYHRVSSPRRWAIACLELAQCYAYRREANPAANLREALRLLDTAVEVLTAERYPEDFALAQSRRGNLLLDIGSDTAHVEQSLLAFEATLKIYNRESYPYDWALVLSNMATAYLTRGGYTEFDDLHRAVSTMEQTLSVRTIEAHPYEWAITQMNIGLALSRLPASDKGKPHRRAIEALRGAYGVLHGLGDQSGKASAAYNLGINIARIGDPSLAQEACDRLEESLPWLQAANQTEQASDALTSLSDAYVAWLHNEAAPARADEICRRALAAFKDHPEKGSGMKIHHEVGLWLLRHAESFPHRLEIASVAFERVLGATRSPQYADLRAGTLANFATVLLLHRRGSRELNRVRARDCLDEALRILRSLPGTPEREEQIGLIIMNQVRSGFGIGLSDS
jgi:tetratricopeptide (TPR) repeat protein